MGYYANGSGTITVTTQDENMLDGITDILTEALETDDTSGPNNTTDITVWNDGKYYNDLIEETLASATDYAEKHNFQIAEGDIRFFGEDESVWRFYFDTKKKVWKEEGAEIVFVSDMSGASDELLRAAVDEYNRRRHKTNDAVISSPNVRMLSPEDYGKLHGKSKEIIKRHCQNGRIPGAYKTNQRSWAIPENAPYPEDKRLTANGKYVGKNRK